MSLPDGYVLGNATTTVTIADNDIVKLRITDVTANEDQAFKFAVTANTAPITPVSFAYTVKQLSQDTATAGVDFTAVESARTITMAVGVTVATITVAVEDDELDEVTETFTVTCCPQCPTAVWCS